MKIPTLTKDDLYEGQVTECSCKKPAPPELPVGTALEPMDAITIAEEGSDTGASESTAVNSEPHGKGPTCLPWVKITRDPTRFRACLAEARKMGAITSSEKLYNVLKEYMTAEDVEVFYVVLLDTQLFVRGIGELARGARDRVQTPVPDILRLAIIDGAMAFAVAHNHPSGKATPSEADKELTKAILEGANAVDILLMDHIVVGADKYYSFADHGLL